MFVLLVAVFLFIPSPLIACRCNFKFVNALAEEPTKAKVSYVGVVTKVEPDKGSIHKIHLSVIRSWKGVQGGTTSFLDALQSSCAVGLMKGQRYLLVTDLPPDSLWGMCSTIALPIENASKLIQKLDAKGK